MGEITPFGLAYSQRATDPTGSELVEKIATGGVKEYVSYGLAVTDAPPIFHLAVGLSVLATACGGRTTFRGGGNRIHWPNLYVLFVAPSGLMRKSTSIDIGLNILRRADPDAVMPNETSREEFLRVQGKNPEGIVRESEFASALARYSRDHMAGMKELLTDLWDCQNEYRRQIKGREGTGEKLIIKKPALNYLAASTIEWLIESLTENDLRSGFLARFLIFPSATEGDWVSFFADIEDGTEERLAILIRSVREMPEAHVDFHAVLKPFNVWSREMKELAKLAPPEMTGFYSRLPLFTAKICTLLAVSENGRREAYSIECNQYERATILMEWLRSKYEELLEQKLIFSKEERVMQRLLDQVRKDGKIDWQIGLKRSHLKVQDYERYISTLLQRRDIRIVSEATRGRPAKVIYLETPRLGASIIEPRVAPPLSPDGPAGPLATAPLSPNNLAFVKEVKLGEARVKQG